MICEQPGHLTHSPSGTRLGFSLAGVTIGLRSFLNHAMSTLNGSGLWTHGPWLSRPSSRDSTPDQLSTVACSVVKFRLDGLEACRGIWSTKNGTTFNTEAAELAEQNAF